MIRFLCKAARPQILACSMTALYLLSAWILPSCFLSSVIFPGIEANAQSDEENSTNLRLYAQSAILMDAGSGRILYEKNGHEKRPMASTTKIMTCILTLECGNLEDEVEVSSYAAGMPKVRLGIRQGKTYKLRGSTEGFAKMMNQKARDIGCFDTFFITPNGLDATAQNDDGEMRVHSTTAADLARIMSYCIMDSPKREEFLTITRTPAYQFSSNGRSFYCNNHNAFLGMMEGALSGKTGFTGNAGYCYVGALQRDGKTYVVALLACGWPNNKTYKWSDTKALMNYGLENYEYCSLADMRIREEELDPIPVAEGQTQRIGGKVFARVTIAGKKGEKEPEGLLLSEKERIEVKKEIKESLTAPVNAGEEVGTISYMVGDEVYGVDYIVTKERIDAIDFKWCFTKILENYMVCL